MKSKTFLILFLVVVLLKVTGLTIITDEIRLHHDLFKRPTYNPAAFPRLDGDIKPINVKIGITLNQIVDLSTSDGEIIINAFIRQKWNNAILTWNPNSYGGIKRINVFAKQVWVPDLNLYDNVQDDKSFNGFLDTLKTRIILDNNGDMNWQTPIMLRMSCSINVKLFPFDTQICNFKFGVWTYGIRYVLLKPENVSADLSKYTDNVQWRLLSMDSFVVKNKYDCCPEPFDDVVFRLVAKRKPLFLFVNLIAPNLIFSFMTILVYVIPNEAGEKAGHVVNLFLAMALFLTSAINLIPGGSDGLSLFNLFLGLILIAMLLLTITMCYSLSIYYAYARILKMPCWMRHYLLNHLAPFMGIKVRVHTLDWKKITRGLQKIMPSEVNSTLDTCHPGRLWAFEDMMEGKSIWRQRSLDKEMLKIILDKLDILMNTIEAEEQIAYRQAEWTAVSKALDKFCFWFFTSTFLLIISFCAFKGAIQEISEV